MDDYTTSLEGGACYTPHNSTFLEGSKGQNLPSALFWVGASKVKVTKPGDIKSQRGGGKRGVVKLFSGASRKRLLRRLAEIEREAKPYFCTLTFPDEYISCTTSPVEWKKALKRFIQAFRRQYPSGGMVWRLELQKRKSGQYVGTLFPHYHLLVYGVGDIIRFRYWLSKAWWRSAGKLSDAHLKAGTNAVETTGGTRLIVYVSKYMAKTDVNISPSGVGRVWGVCEAENIPFVRAILVQLTPEESYTLLRYLRRFAGIRGRDYASLTVFLDAGQWWRKLGLLLYPD